MKNRIVAALLAFFFGGIGVHKFYLGQVGKGFLYLIFSWTGIPAILAFIDFIIYLCIDDEKFKRNVLGIVPAAAPEAAPTTSENNSNIL